MWTPARTIEPATGAAGAAGAQGPQGIQGPAGAPGGAVWPIGGIPPWSAVGRSYALGRVVSGSNGVAVAPGGAEVRLYPFMVGRDATVNQLSVYCTALSAGLKLRAGIYASDPANFYAPAALLGETGELDLASTGQKTSGVLAIALTAGTVYWAGHISSAAAGTCRGMTESEQWVGLIGYTDPAINAVQPTMVRRTVAYGAMPNPLGALDAVALNVQSLLVFARFT